MVLEYQSSKGPNEPSVLLKDTFHLGLHCFLRIEQSSEIEVKHNLEISTCDPLKYIMNNPDHIVLLEAKLFADTYLVLVGFDSVCPSRHFFSHVGTGLPWLNQY